MHVLAALQEEKNMLEEAISYQNRMEAKLMAMPPNDFGHDLTKLKEICQQQQDQLMVIRLAPFFSYPSYPNKPFSRC